jgi:ABC-type nitrate/sulfonate/bicarbonate transport system permease component
MREIFIGIAAAIVVAICAGIWLGTVQTSATDRYTVANSVRR